MTPIRKICEASGLPIELFTDTSEDNVSQLIVAWYEQHRRSGGDPDPVAEDLIAEAVIEHTHGQHVSHRPGNA